MDNEGVLYLVCNADFQRFIVTELCKPAFAMVETQMSLHKYPRNGMDFCSVSFGARRPPWKQGHGITASSATGTDTSHPALIGTTDARASLQARSS